MRLSTFSLATAAALAAVSVQSIQAAPCHGSATESTTRHLISSSYQADVFETPMLELPSAPAAMRLLAGAIRRVPFLAELTEPRLVQTAHDQHPYWTTELGKMYLRWSRQNFFDLTATLGSGIEPIRFPTTASSLVQSSSFPNTTYHEKHLQGVFAEISDAGPKENLKGFTSFRNRYYRSETGKQSQQWLLKLIQGVVADVPYISVREHKHSWGQNSILLHISGAKSSSAEQGRIAAVAGAHLDSTHQIPFLPAPGADDDGSGTVTLIEALRALLSKGWRPVKDIEFHWYSAEEGGLLGSQEVAQAYAAKGVRPSAMLQQDMTAFVKPGTEARVGIVSDFVSTPLTDFVRLLVNTYLEIPPVETKLGYAGSDHASWTKVGVPSAFAIEATFEDSNLQRIHTTGDTIDAPGFSFDHLVQFVRLTSAFVVELGGWAEK
ncbi:Zn-dependent exopeptidase [Ceraceosorus guamensis]|uniref:Peptide hydrolase n=1 Tax=Ceraceosorus guamensis TaxID=1522189 RepID=A0A316W957_9BASI|nr:Zn-dependent exopeptidase [Ceraceosorus guamensis]PWN45588.1 Zn-dependent exopeptidase [Ceraceosorus guamensis]